MDPIPLNLEPAILDDLETKLTQRLNYILDPAASVIEPVIEAIDPLHPEDTDPAEDTEAPSAEFCANCLRVDRRTRFTPVAYLMRRFAWRADARFLEFIAEYLAGRCYYLSTLPEFLDHFLDRIYQRVQYQQEYARMLMGRLPFRQYLYRPGMPGASRCASQFQYQHSRVPTPWSNYSLGDLRQKVRQLANRVDAVDAATILTLLGSKYHLS